MFFPEDITQFNYSQVLSFSMISAKDGRITEGKQSQKPKRILKESNPKREL